MLVELRLRDFVIVDSLELEFGPGFTVLSGETGAGKSILIDALGLVLGARADTSVVREGTRRADISALFRTDPTLDAWLAERELSGDAGQVWLRRVVEVDGRSRALINGHPATVAQLRELGDCLVEIHGQHASQSLLRTDGQRALLDRFAGTDPSRLAHAHARWRDAQRDLLRAQDNARDLSVERERLQWQHDEIALLSPAEGEWDTLNAEEKRLSHAASLLEGSRAMADALNDAEDSIAERLHGLQQRLKSLAALDTRLQPGLELLEAATIQAQEAASLLSAYADRVDLDPQRLAQTEQRISALFSVARKLKLAPQQLATELESLRVKLDALEDAQDVATLTRRLEAARQEYDEQARGVTAGRERAAAELSAGVTQRIERLGMQGGRLSITIEPGEPTVHGVDRIDFRVAGHSGASPRSLAKVASGGELSRISLAISELAAQANPVPTLIFDEADAGVGGAVAEVIGELMRKLGESRQVLCVTHLPQVAAKGNQHLCVSKDSTDTGTVSRIEVLERARRIDEIARMLGGVEITATTRKHARELLG